MVRLFGSVCVCVLQHYLRSRPNFLYCNAFFLGKIGLGMRLVLYSSNFLLPLCTPRPLSEGKNLKTKFDDIFASTRYTKALENIKKLRTEQV